MAVFLKIDGMEGNSVATGHEGWIDVELWSWGCSNRSNVMQGGGGASATTSEVQGVSVTLVTGKSAINLFHFCITGQHIKEITLETTKTTGGEEGKHISILMKTCQITAIGESGSKDGFNSDIVQIEFEEYEHEIFEQAKDGVLSSAGKHGFNVKTRVVT